MVDVSADVGRVRLQQRSRTTNLDRLRHRAHGHLHVNARHLIQDKFKRRAERGLKALRFHLHPISPNRDVREVVRTVGVSLRRIRRTARDIRGRHRRARNGRAARVGDRSVDGRRRLLAPGRRPHRQQ